MSDLSKPLYLRCVDRGTGETLYTPCGNALNAEAAKAFLTASLREFTGSEPVWRGIPRHQ